MGNNNYDDYFMERFTHHYARVGSVPQCIPLLRDDFPQMEVFNKADLNQLIMRKRKNLGYCPMKKAREEYMSEIEGLNTTAIDNIRNGKNAIDDGIDILIEKLNRCNELLGLSEVGTKEFSILMMTQQNLMTSISRYSGIDAAMDLKKAMAFSLLKQGKGKEATEVLTGEKVTEESIVPRIMDDDYSDEDEDDNESIDV